MPYKSQTQAAHFNIHRGELERNLSYSITASARVSREVGISMPSAFAV
jgi:hypothetical protein